MPGRLKILLLFILFSSLALAAPKTKYAIVVSANAEWRIVKEKFKSQDFRQSPWGEYFFITWKISGKDEKLLFFHEGWGKTAAAGATQYVIDRFDPDVLVNIGTCGGFDGKAELFDVILADRTVIYDIKEAMGDSREAIRDYSTDIDLSWLPDDSYPSPVRKSVLISADRDLVPSEIKWLSEEFGASAGDWESASIAYTCKRNGKRLIILRGVTDIVTQQSGEAYNNFPLFEYRTGLVMSKLIDALPGWIGYLNRAK